MAYSQAREPRRGVFKKIGDWLVEYYVWVMLELMILGLGSYAVYQNLPVRPEDVQQITITVEDMKWHGQKKASPSHLDIYAESGCYLFINSEKDKPEAQEIYEKRLIAVGDEISISYIRKVRDLGMRNIVVEAHTDTDVLRTVEGYNAKHKPGVNILIFSIINGIYVFLVIKWELWTHSSS